MPTRILREGILTSDRVDQLDWPAEVFYRRLMSKVDDHGLYDARPSMLRATLYPLRVDRVREADISRWMATCQKAGLIVLYEAGGKSFLKMLYTRWEKRGAAKYPQPPPECEQPLATENSCTQPLTVGNSCTQPFPSAPVVEGEVVFVFEGEGKSNAGARARPCAKGVNGDAADAALTLPDWIPKTQWDAWIEARTRRRNRPTAFALKLAIAKLADLRDQGHAPGAVLAQSAFRGWAGLFPVKEDA
jgi:hypothetical protein